MAFPPLPRNEGERLSALRRYGVLDTPPEAAFDDLARLAAHVCETPIALISLMDEERLWFKSVVGFSLTELPRDQTFCAYSLLEAPRPLVIVDTLEDERFAAHPLVVEPPGIRFYAGAQLMTSDGHALGTLCVMDTEPRELNAAQIGALQSLARQIVDQLELRRTTERLGTSTEDLAQTRRRLDVARQEIASLTRDKSEVLASVSHEIRTPLNGVLGMLALVDEAGLDEEAQFNLRTARESAEALLRLVNDLLDLSKAEAGRIVVEQEPFELAGVVSSVASMLAGRARMRGVPLAIDIAPDVPPVVRGDSARVLQVLVNLVGNAIKFTEEGTVTLRVRAGVGPTVIFDVHDTGIGIPQHRQAEIFKRYVQADASTTRRFGGTGLGLAICRHLVEAMDGALSLESEVGKGSTFSVALALPAATLAADVVVERHRGRARLAGLRVLVAEDNVVNQRIAQRMLEKLGCVVTVVDDGREALARACNGFDAILMDCRMPGLDGYEAAQAIRTACATPPPVIALTASAHDDDHLRCLESGMVTCLAKPVRLESLEEALVAYAVPHRQGAAVSGRSTEG